jgi:hypothetical protein
MGEREEVLAGVSDRDRWPLESGVTVELIDSSGFGSLLLTRERRTLFARSRICDSPLPQDPLD